jgi:TPR repeat protein
MAYQRGREVIKDETLSAEFYALAAAQGHAPAQFNIGECCRRGSNVDHSAF